MKDRKLLIAVLVLLVSNVICVAGWDRSISQVDAYHEYYKAAEDFLDELDKKYDWVDAFDPEAYYDASHRIESL